MVQSVAAMSNQHCPINIVQSVLSENGRIRSMSCERSARFIGCIFFINIVNRESDMAKPMAEFQKRQAALARLFG